MEYSLYGGGTTTNKTVALKAKEAFIQSFEANWKESVADTRLDMIRYVAELEPEEGIDFLILGLRDFSRSVREESKKILALTASRVAVSDADESEMTKEKAIVSERVSSAVYNEIIKIISLDELRVYLSTLLEIGYRGPCFVWKFFLKKIIPPNVFIDIVRRFPEQLKLRFVYQWLFSEVSLRRKNAAFIRPLLKEITETDAATEFIVSVIDTPADDPFANVTRAGAILYEFMERLELQATTYQKSVTSDDTDSIISGIKLAVVTEDIPGVHKYLHYLSGENDDLLRLQFLDILSKSHAENDSVIIDAVRKLLDDTNPKVVTSSFRTLIMLNIPDQDIIACSLLENKPSYRAKLYRCLCDMKAEYLIKVLESLPETLVQDARKTVARELLRENPDRFDALFGYYKTDSDDSTRSAAETLFKMISQIRKKEREDILSELSPLDLRVPEPLSSDAMRPPDKKIIKRLKERIAEDSGEKTDFQEEVFSGINLRGYTVKNADLSGAVFRNCDLSSTSFSSVYLRNARFENVNMQNAVFSSVRFDGCVFINVDSESARFSACSFREASITDTRFEFAEMPETLFTGSSILNTDFSRSDLSFASFTGASLGLCDFSYASMFQSDFFHTTCKLCTFTESGLSSAQVDGHSDLEARSPQWNSVEMPQLFFSKRLLDTRWMNILILTSEMDRQREIFNRFNNRSKERAFDSFRPEQEDLFELVPLLIHLTQRILPIEKKTGDAFLTENIMLKNTSSGISNYFPSQKTVGLAKKYLGVEKLLLLPGKECFIDALFTIGSIGTIAQSSDSDIDYWVCVDRNRMGEDAVELLRLKLDSIEKWARVRFATELHLFIVDPSNVRKGRFGGSDFESSGSAQGMILKEEFYRTMILVAGKIPFWSIIPAWTDDRYYTLLYAIASRFHDDYLDLGNVSAIPPGEYFGASMWQLFKSLTSPYKSVMKMALLEKYIQEGQRGQLLCNRLKRRWAGGKFDLVRHDPYLLLFEEIAEYYKKTGQNDIVSLVQLCFFLKLGIRSIKQLNKSTFRFRKLLVKRCIERFSWEEDTLCDLGYFDEWPYEKVINLSNLTGNYMIGTYRKLSGLLNGSEGYETLITGQDITILGRKMFVQFSSHPYKVKTLPHVARGRNLFKQLYIYYRQEPKKEPVWEVYPRFEKSSVENSNDGAVLKEVNYIEEVAAWVIHNGIFASGTTLSVLPNPTSVSAQDFNELLKEMDSFFIAGEGDTMPSEAYLEQFKIHCMYIIANFSVSRKTDKIEKYAAVYMTTWGEIFCRVYQSRKGVTSIAEAFERVKEDLGVPFSSNARLGCHIPKMARKRIRDLLPM